MVKNNSVLKTLMLFGFLLGPAFVFSGCPLSAGQNSPIVADSSTTDNTKTNKNMANLQNTENTEEKVSTDIDQLAENINLPVRPEQVFWKKKIMNNEGSDVPGPNDYLLIAVLKYSDADIEKLEEETGYSKNESANGVAEIEEWFPADLKASAKETDGEKSLTGEKYDAATFARSPFNNGSLLRIEKSNYFVLKLFSM